MCKVFAKSILLVLFAVFSAGIACAQAPGEMTLTELVSAAGNASNTGDYRGAIPFLTEIIKRAATYEDPASVRSVQKVRLQLGQTYAQLGRGMDAEKYIRQYLSNKPCPERAMGLTILCQVALEAENWTSLKEAARELLEERDKKVGDRERAEFYLVQAHYNLGEFAAALEFLPLILERENDPNVRDAFHMMQANSLFETGQTEQLIASLSQMLRGDARYDIGKNLLLIRIGDHLFDKDSLDEALFIYRMVMSEPDLISWQENQMAGMRRQLAQMEQEKNAEAGEKIKSRMETIKRDLAALREIPSYDLHIAYRMAQVYAQRGRVWEAITLFDRLYQSYPEDEEGNAAFYKMLVLLFDMGRNEEAMDRAQAYLETNRTGLYPRMVAANLMRYHYEQGDKDAVLDVFGYSEKWEKSDSIMVNTQEAAVRYMAGFVIMERRGYARGAEAFEEVVEFAPDSLQAVDARYWIAMCSQMQQDYQGAYDLFVRYRRNYPDATLAPAALFRAAVCRFGLEDYDGAKEMFGQFIASYPDDSLIPEALGMRGDLLGAEGALDEALVDYRKAINLTAQFYRQAMGTPAVNQVVFPATYAISQMASTLELEAMAYRDRGEYDTAEAKYRQIVEAVEQYESLFGDSADWAQAVFLKGKAQFQLGEAGKAVQAYLDTVIRYGADPAQQGVAAILFDLGTIINSRLTPELRDESVARLRDVRDEAESRTLQLRVNVLLAELDGTQADLGRRLLAEEDELVEIPPSALGLMCSAAVAQQDFSRSEELFSLFLQRYDMSPYINSAYQLRAEALFSEERYSEALTLASKALEVFGTASTLGWAQVLKGRAEFELGEYAQAAETFNGVFNVPQWRGPVYAEAMFRMADAWFAQENFEKAFVFYQRTYLLYNFYDNGRWAADAYLKSAECLNKLNRASAARNTYRAMLLDEAIRELPQADSAKKALGPEETAELMAGQTNRLETVFAEGEL